MGYLSLEDIYPDDVKKYGHMRVGMTDLYVKDNHDIYGVVTRGEYRELTSRLLRDNVVQMIISAQLTALPGDYDPWIRRIERNRALHARYGDKFDPWGERLKVPTSNAQMQRVILLSQLASQIHQWDEHGRQ